MDTPIKVINLKEKFVHKFKYYNYLFKNYPVLSNPLCHKKVLLQYRPIIVKKHQCKIDVFFEQNDTFTRTFPPAILFISSAEPQH
jgi:hypothetical protein